jgi:hypothetical protein
VAAVTVLIVVAVVTAGWITLREFQVQRTVYDKILRDKLDFTREQFRGYLRPVGENLGTMVRWSEAGLLDPAAPDRLGTLLIPLVDPAPQISAVYVVPAAGRPRGFLRAADGWRAVPADSLATVRGRPWYERAAADVDTLPLWSRYGPLPGDGREALVATRRAGDVVLGLGLLAADLNAFAATAPITENGILIRRHEKNGQVTWLAPQAGSVLDVADGGQLLVSERPEHQTIGQALLHWGQLGQPEDETFRFRHDGRTWWCVFYGAEDGVDPGQLGMIVPAGDLHARLQTSRGTVTFLFGVLLALAMLAVVAMAFDYRNKWRRFAHRRLAVPPDAEALQRLIEGGETDQVEFKSTMRWNLHAGKPGKEIELAWLKTVVAYLNTDGGFVVIGVKDDGTVLGLDRDDFRNDDKLRLHFENLIKQHVGLLHAPYVRGEIREVGGDRVFLVACERCPEPAYLRNGDDEKFFVRIGPSTHVVPASRIHDYLDERGA